MARGRPTPGPATRISRFLGFFARHASCSVRPGWAPSRVVPLISISHERKFNRTRLCNGTERVQAHARRRVGCTIPAESDRAAVERVDTGPLTCRIGHPWGTKQPRARLSPPSPRSNDERGQPRREQDLAPEIRGAALQICSLVARTWIRHLQSRSNAPRWGERKRVRNCAG